MGRGEHQPLARVPIMELSRHQGAEPTFKHRHLPIPLRTRLGGAKAVSQAFPVLWLARRE